MTSLFVDTAYWVAIEATSDQYHEQATKHWKELLHVRPKLVTTSFVLDEVVTFLVSRGHQAKAVAFARRLLNSPSVEIVHVDEPLFLNALDYLARRPDKGYSLTDCVSFVLMERVGLHAALTFDAHFEQAGFLRIPATQR